LSLSMGFVCKDCGGYLDVRDILKQRDEARDLLRRAYNEAMDHYIHELDKEGVALWGIKSEDLTASPGPRYTSDGLLAVIEAGADEANIVDFTTAGSLTKRSGSFFRSASCAGRIAHLTFLAPVGKKTPHWSAGRRRDEPGQAEAHDE